jgi:hypothetical protein
MQDSENIFDLTPIERINVFKDIFNLLDIDSNKAIIAEKRKEVQLKLKIQKDTGKYDDKLKLNIAEIIAIMDNIKDNENYNNIAINDTLEEFNKVEFWDDIRAIGDKLNVDSLDISDIKYHLLENTLNTIDTIQKNHQELLNRKDSLSSEFEKNNQKNNLFNIESKDKTYKKQELKNILINLKQNDKKTIKEKKESLIKNQKSIFEDMNLDILIKHGYKIDDIWQLNDLIEKLINQ